MAVKGGADFEIMEEIHVAVLPSSGSGHINPMLELSRRLVPEGFKVSFLLPEDKVPSKQQEVGIRFVSFPTTNKFLPHSPELQDPIVTLCEAQEPPPKCLISDCFLGWSQDVANRLGIPRVAVWCANTLAETLCSSVRLLASKGCLPAKVDDETLITFIPGVPPLKPRQLPLALRGDNPAMYILGDVLARLQEALCVVTNAVEELEQEIVNARRAEFKHYFPVGPLIPAAVLRGEDKTQVDMSETGQHCMTWLEKQTPQSVLYIAFGSVTSLPGEQAEKIVEALRASGVPFLWAIRRNFVTGVGEEFYDSLKTRLGSQGLVVEWAPQIQILQHKSVGAFFTHCGWNSTLETLCCGVPTVCWPLHAEQNLNCFNMVELWKVGKKVAEGTDDAVSKEEIEKVILEVMEGEVGTQMKAKVEVLKATVMAGVCSQRNIRELKVILKGV